MSPTAVVGKTLSEQNHQHTSRKRISTKSMLLILLVVAGSSAVAYGFAYALNAATADAHLQGDAANWRPYPGRFGNRRNETSSFRALSTVDNVSVTGFTIASSNQVSITLTYSGSETSPAITIVTLAPGLSGSNTLAAGWGSPATATVNLVGTGTLSSTWQVGVLIVPFTGA